ncbi:MAG: VWA domain-containing protein [Lachnospiraceae bacterium]|nr:VWA domain-containing protein [Lachnospiraceae bacterium]
MKRITAFIAACLLCILLCPKTAMAETGDTKNERCVISVAVDVSGSMRRTDSRRDIPETIKMIMDACDDNDRFSVVAYNDQIAYESGLIDLGDAKAKEKLKSDLDALVYDGNTDNGLGMMRAVNIVKDAADRDKGLVIQISDGNTDLVGSNTGRNAQDSKQDIEKSAAIAQQEDIPIYVIEYTDNFTTDTSLMSMAASSTGGGVTMVDEPQEFVQVMLNSFFAGYNNGKTYYTMQESEGTLTRAKFDTLAGENETEVFFLYSWERIVDLEVLNKDFTIRPESPTRYFLLEAKDQTPASVEVLYGLEKKGKVILGSAKAAKPKEPEQEVIVKEIEVVVTPESAVPMASDITLEMYSEKAPFRYGVSILFTDDDIVSYELLGTDERVVLEEGILTFDVSKEGEITTAVVAKDAAGNTATSTIVVKVTASWRQYQKWLVLGIIFFIVLVTAIICFVIIRRLLFHKEDHRKPLRGELIARFIDIKSKNDFDEVRWRLKDFPRDGVSLEELFHAKGIREELKDIDKVCFYPCEEDHAIALLHNIEGGVFIGDHHVKSNVPTIVRSGSKIYVSIAENASEIELTYLDQ